LQKQGQTMCNISYMQASAAVRARHSNDCPTRNFWTLLSTIIITMG